MHRRRFCALAAVALAGCVTDDGNLEAEGRIETRRTADGPATPDGNGETTLGEYWYVVEHADEGEDAIDAAPEVETLAIEGDTLVIEIDVSDGGNRRDQIGVAVVPYAWLVEERGGPARLEGYVVDGFGDRVEKFRCKREWAEAWNAGEVSDEEFLRRVYATVEAV